MQQSVLRSIATFNAIADNAVGKSNDSSDESSRIRIKLSQLVFVFELEITTEMRLWKEVECVIQVSIVTFLLTLTHIQ